MLLLEPFLCWPWGCTVGLVSVSVGLITSGVARSEVHVFLTVSRGSWSCFIFCEINRCQHGNKQIGISSTKFLDW